MTKDKEGVRWICREMITSPYCIGLCLSEKSFRKELKSLKVPEKLWPDTFVTEGRNGEVHFFDNYSNPSYCAIVCIRPSERADFLAVAGLIVHESVHVWRNVLEKLGESRPSSEFEAYGIQTISMRLIHAYKKSQKRKK